MSVSPAEFRAALRQFTTGVTVVTTRDAEGRPCGLTANAFTSVSLDPPLVLVCVDRAAQAYPALEAHGWFAINVLGAHQEQLSRQFAASGQDKFAGVTFHEGRARLPILDRVIAALECRVVQRHESGDHTIFVGEVEQASIYGGAPLVFYGGAYRQLE